MSWFVAEMGAGVEVTGQFADKPTCVQRSQTRSLAKMFNAKFEKNNHSICDIYKFAVGDLTNPQIVQSVRVIQSATWFVGDMSSKRCKSAYKCSIK